MAKTALEMTKEQLAAYHTGAAVRRREVLLQPQTQARWEQAQRLARQAAQRLREEFGVRRVVLFGSALRRPSFTPWSDVDLAAWGLPPERFYAAVAAVTSLSTEIAVDLVDPDRCPAALRTVIEREGVEL
ncbi:MAG: nucleotidyltransferase domain-containing protein [Sedimentisphaerales bacterium]|nr:nucleotidyltransferase domain-containing protein [Sedimentisphaerales bacterium]